MGTARVVGDLCWTVLLFVLISLIARFALGAEVATAIAIGGTVAAVVAFRLYLARRARR